jgi:hypothetical protein
MKYAHAIPFLAALATACSSERGSNPAEVLPDCTLSALPGIEVTVQDSLTAQPVLTVGTVMVEDAPYVERAVSLPPRYFGAYERAGTYAVSVDVPGYQTWRVGGVRVSSDRCHVITVPLTARLIR